MKLSSRGRYGVRAMFELALQHNEGAIPLRSVAEKQDISEHYLEQLIASLRKAGLVKSVRGAQGGYMLAKEPSQITVGDIVRVLEGPVAPVECVNEDQKGEGCQKADECVTRMIWERLRDKINEVLDATTLEDMCKEAEKLKGENCYMYYI